VDDQQELAALKWNWEASGFYRIAPPAEPGAPWVAVWLPSMSAVREIRVEADTAAGLRTALQEDFPVRMTKLGLDELDKLKNPGRRPTNPAAGGPASGAGWPSFAYGAAGGSGFSAVPAPGASL
jgi:hypothetical protein